LIGAHAGALSTLCGIGLSYHRDLQQVKRLAMQTIERGTALLHAFEIGWNDLHFDRDAMSAHAGDGFTVATDIADALILAGVSARRAHALVGEAVARAEAEARPFDASDLAWLAQRAEIGNLSAPLDPRASIESKRTGGSTAPFSVAQAIDALEHSVDALGFLKT
jgi:argininosuccinate lyase